MADLLSIAAEAVKMALKFGADEAEAYVSDSRTQILGYDLSTKGPGLPRAELKKGVALRVIRDRKLGFWPASLRTGHVEEAAKKAVSLAKMAGNNQSFLSFPEPQGRTEVKDIYDDEIANMNDQEFIELSASLRSEITNQLAAERLHEFGGLVIAGTHKFAIVNSVSLEVEEKGTSLTFDCFGDGRMGGYSHTARTLREFRIAEIAESYVQDVPSVTKVEKIGMEKASCVLEPKVVQRLLGLLRYLVNACKVGEKIVSEKITQISDGTLPGGPGTASVDGEGIPTTRTIIIENGVLRGHIYDYFSALMAGTKSTGNLVRSGYRSQGYDQEPRIGFQNLILKEGKKSKEQMIQEIDDGFLIWSTHGGGFKMDADQSFSCFAHRAYRIRNGEIVSLIRGHPLIFGQKPLDNVCQLTRKPLRALNYIIPSMLVGGLTIVGDGVGTN